MNAMPDQSLSFGQEHMWFLDRLDPGDASHNVLSASRLYGEVDAGLLDRALGEVVARHEQLRSRFPSHDGLPVQVVDPPGRIRLEVVDRTAIPAGRWDEEAATLLSEWTNGSFDLAEGPLLRVRLIAFGPRDHVLCVVAHHIVCDGWSFGVLIGELTALYTAFLDGKPSPLPPPPCGYGDFVAEQRLMLDGDEAAESLAYWRRELTGAAPLELPTDRPRPAVRGTRGASHQVPLPRDLVEGVQRFARAERCTPFMVFLAAYQLLLAGRSGADDVSVGSVAASRDRVEYEAVIGHFVTTLVFRGDLSGDPAFRALLRQTRRKVMGAFQHRRVPAERALEGSDAARDLSRNPLFQTVFVLHSMGDADLALPGVRVEMADSGFHASPYDLALQIFNAGDDHRMMLTYSTDLFDAETVAGYARDYQTLLERLVEEPEARLSHLLAPRGEERRVLVEDLNRTGRPLPAVPAMVTMFEERARATPDAPAVVAGDTVLRYAELDAAAERLAARLRAGGAGLGELVAVSLPRSADMVVGLLAVMKTGAAYLPVDADYPPARVALVLQDADPALLLTHGSLAGHLPAGRARVILVDAPGGAGDVDQETAAAEPPEGFPARARRAADPAYVLYTSGSTGRPKGVVVPNGALVNFLVAMRDLLDADPGTPAPGDRPGHGDLPASGDRPASGDHPGHEDRPGLAGHAAPAAPPGTGRDEVWLALTSLSFDISALELYLPLVTGGTVVVADGETARDGARLARLIRDTGVTHVQATPSGWWPLLDAGFDDERLTALVGGEALPLAQAVRLRARVRRLINVYGPTETTIWSTAWDVPENPTRVRIGRPIANTRVHVMGRNAELAPAGAPGELLIGGDGLADGYLRRPGLTADRFVPDPFGPPGARLYRTGDVVRRHPDGTLEYLGRSDNQVKLRGHRIELGEVESVVEEHPGVRQAVVAVRDELLVAYVVGDAAPEDLRAAVAERLPSWMTPTVFVTLDSLPLTPNGKIDRRALPAPGPSRRERAATPPRTPAERLVASTFAEVLGRNDVDALDDFFTLGGHSLLAIKTVARLGDALGVDLPVRELFLRPAVADLAAVLETLTGRRAVPLRRREPGAVVPLSAAQERLWFLHRLDPADASYSMYLVRRLRGPLDREALRGALGVLAARHESLRTRFPHEDGLPRTVVEPPGPVPLEELDLSHLPADRREAEARAATAARVNAPLDLEAAPPLRWTLLTLGAGDHVLCGVVHHILGDGWSLNVMFEELTLLYDARVRGTDAGLPEPPVQYGDFALWQRRREALGAGEESLAYWRDRLAGVPALDLPTDRPRSAGAGHGGAFHPLRIPGDLAARLEELARSRGATLFMLLLAAYQVLLSRHSGQHDFAVGSPTAGRDRVELEPVVGYFTNTLVLRADLSGDPSFGDLLARTATTVLGAMEHQEVPFERLLPALEIERDPTRTPLFQTMMILHSQDADTGPGGRFGGLSAEPFEHGYAQAKFDLMLEAWRGPGSLSLVFGYDTGLFTAATVAAMAGRLEVLLRALPSLADTPVSALPVLTAEDEALLARAADGGPAGTVSVPEEVARAVRLHPGATAVECGGSTLSYAGLDARVAALAALLRERGVSAGDVVGVCLGRTADTVPALLAVWRAGAAYLPLDPAYPAERLAFLVGDSGAAAVVTTAGHAVRLPPGVPTVVLDDAGDGGSATGAWAGTEDDTGAETGAGTESEAGAETGAENGTGAKPEAEAETEAETGELGGGTGAEAGAEGRGGENGPGVGRVPMPGEAAYLIYTSGSTGVPKGVVATHGGLAARVSWMREHYGLGPGDRVVQFASLSFDTHAEEIYPALAAGACVVMLPDGAATLPDLLASPRGNEITVLDLPTAYWHRLVETIDEVAWPASLRLVVLGGEQVHGTHVARWRERFGDRVRLVNTYGPTEATVIATAAELTGAGATGSARENAAMGDAAGTDGETPPIGRPIGGATAWILDPAGRPVPPGAPGELCLGGPGITLGYHRRPGQTAERFLPDPSGPPGSRLYRSGDRARLRPDGRIEFLGRLDAQVKVRGHRIEPGEIETRLLAHPKVSRAAVVARGDVLAAYVVGGGTAEELRAHLSSVLPRHLVPDAWVWLDTLPLTVSGKVDVAALPAPGPQAGAGHVPPRTDTEELVAEVWAEVLGLERVGALDDFFALGGHSLLAVRLVSRLRAETGVEVPIRTLFANATVETLALALEDLVAEALAELEPDGPTG
ncbi:non-ribosomal peptide synthetase [Streptosporangium carneum]|uniref:Carrier domain-containing protein n=1 Tax=Streptosporangium carneum TaxID=47481 RepID=A0A9W6I3E3_9ACTN|nr:non-ribosomal peptide synthetase [Streptosporangium carneum]GLK10953.1 hypothetical protein GCM10017600_43590 [Streptosporangium carneum]